MPTAAAIPISGARSHSVPSAVAPCRAGKAVMPTTAISTVTTTTPVSALNRLLGRLTPGSRASSARFDTVSRPVYASIASGSANRIPCHDGELPRCTPCVSACAEKTSANPSATSISWMQRSSTGSRIAKR